MEYTREHFFNWKDLNIDKVVEIIQQDPSRTRDVMDFIAHEMKKEEELKEKLAEMKEDYHKRKHELIEEYWMEDLYK